MVDDDSDDPNNDDSFHFYTGPAPVTEEASWSSRGRRRGWNDPGHWWWPDRSPLKTLMKPGDEVEFVVRKHWVVMVEPTVRGLAGLLTIWVPWGRPLWAAVFVVSCFLFARNFFRWQRALLGSLAVTVLMALAVGDGSYRIKLIASVIVVAWSASDVASWWEDQLKISKSRIWREYGVLRTRTASTTLGSVSFLEWEQSFLGRQLGYGTLHLDTAVQQDVALNSFPFVPEPQRVHQEILQRRWEGAEGPVRFRHEQPVYVVKNPHDSGEDD
jgi:hypothetical protein